MTAPDRPEDRDAAAFASVMERADAIEAERDALRVRLEAVEGGIEQVGRLCSRHGQGCHSRCNEPMVPVYRLSDAARAALSPQEGTQ